MLHKISYSRSTYGVGLLKWAEFTQQQVFRHLKLSHEEIEKVTLEKWAAGIVTCTCTCGRKCRTLLLGNDHICQEAVEDFKIHIALSDDDKSSSGGDNNLNGV